MLGVIKITSLEVIPASVQRSSKESNPPLGHSYKQKQRRITKS
jgi:hypothetical protein